MTEQSRNWAQNQTWRPGRVVRPRSPEEVAAVLKEAKDAGSTAKAVGSRYSFTASAATSGVQIVLDALRGIVDVDLSRQLVRVRGGMKVANLNRGLHAHGMALANLGDMDQQTVAGAIATGTHGSGAKLGGLASFVRSLQLAMPDGSLVECSLEQDPDLFAAARVSLGALGVVTEVTLEVVPAFRIHMVEQPMAMSDVLERFDEFAYETDHFEMRWYPHTDRVLATFGTRMAPDDPRDEPRPGWQRVIEQEFVEKVVFGGVRRACSIAPVITPAAVALGTRAMPHREYTSESFDVFVMGRRPRFKETEYAVPSSAVPEVLTALKEWTDRSSTKVPLPVKVRFSAPDDIWMSPSYQRQTAYISATQYHRMPHAAYFDAVEEAVGVHQGRPHWGKLHRLGAAALAELYPRFNDFLAVRDRVDPTRVMANDYLRRVLGD